jgi:hypothetical protein
MHDLNVCWSSLGPAKANAPLIIDANTVLAVAVAFQFFQAIAWRGPQEFEISAASSCASLRVATFAIEPNLLERPVSKKRLKGNALAF